MGAGELKILTHHQSHQGIPPLESKLQWKTYDGGKALSKGMPTIVKENKSNPQVH